MAEVLQSKAFEASPRLQQFLTYVVEETLAGRGDQVRGKLIAVEVYGRKIDSSGAQNLVRVEASRLRRILDEYYAHENPRASLQIRIPRGGYHPSFASMEEPSAPQPATAKRLDFGVAVFAALAVILCLGLASVYYLTVAPRPAEVASASEEARRAALREVSPASLQAKNLAAQARVMLFPVFDLKRQRIALDMYLHVITLAPNLPDGYSGAAQSLAMLAILDPDRSQSDHLAREAGQMADRALDLSPTDPWANAAKSLSLVAAQSPSEAVKRARLALDLAPHDGHVLDLIGVAAILCQEPELAALVSDPDRMRQGSGRFGARNIWGVSQLMLGNNEAVVDAFAGAPAAGDPLSAPSLIFQAVALDQLGQGGSAAKLVAELDEAWPDFPVTFISNIMFSGYPNVRDAIDQTLARHRQTAVR